jgi:hypothetical protein
MYFYEVYNNRVKKTVVDLLDNKEICEIIEKDNKVIVRRINSKAFINKAVYSEVLKGYKKYLESKKIKDQFLKADSAKCAENINEEINRIINLKPSDIGYKTKEDDIRRLKSVLYCL